MVGYYLVVFFCISAIVISVGNSHCQCHSHHHQHCCPMPVMPVMIPMMPVIPWTYPCHHKPSCGFWKCRNGQVIRKELVCDGNRNCRDQSDEVHGELGVPLCRDWKCCPGYRKCDGGMCIHMGKVCDGIRQCVDGSDEVNCTLTHHHQHHHWIGKRSVEDPQLQDTAARFAEGLQGMVEADIPESQ